MDGCLGRVAFAAFYLSIGQKSSAPAWDDLKPVIRDGWKAAAAAVLTRVALDEVHKQPGQYPSLED